MGSCVGCLSSGTEAADLACDRVGSTIFSCNSQGCQRSTCSPGQKTTGNQTKKHAPPGKTSGGLNMLGLNIVPFFSKSAFSICSKVASRNTVGSAPFVSRCDLNWPQCALKIQCPTVRLQQHLLFFFIIFCTCPAPPPPEIVKTKVPSRGYLGVNQAVPQPTAKGPTEMSLPTPAFTQPTNQQ